MKKTNKKIILLLSAIIVILLLYIIKQEYAPKSAMHSINSLPQETQDHTNKNTKVEKLIAPSAGQSLPDAPIRPDINLPANWEITDETNSTLTIATDNGSTFTLAFFEKESHLLAEIWINKNKQKINAILGTPGVQLQDSCIPLVDRTNINVFDCGNGNNAIQYYASNEYNDRAVLSFMGESPVITPEEFANIIAW